MRAQLWQQAMGQGRPPAETRHRNASAPSARRPAVWRILRRAGKQDVAARDAWRPLGAEPR